MSERVTSELLLEHMKAMQGGLSDVRQQLLSLTLEVRAVKGHVAVLVQSDLLRESSLDLREGDA